jgi:flagellar assembly factor FliW
VNIVTTRFGLVRASEADMLRMPEGLIGFRGFTQFVRLPDPEVAGLSWLQSATAPELAFALVPPPLAVGDYRVEIRPGDRTALELDDERQALVYVILNRGDHGGLTVNLQGPVVINPVRRLGRQLVLTSSRYAVRFPLEGQQPHEPVLLPGPQALRASA